MNNEWKRRLAYVSDVLRELVSRDFKLRYKKSILGIGWSLLVPLAQLAVLYWVFHNLLALNIPDYTAFLFAGLLPWMWFQSALMASAMAVVDNRDLVRQVGFPVPILPTITVLSQLIHFLLAFPIMAVFLAMDGHHLSVSLLALPLVILIQFVFTVSLAYVVATLQVSFRDTQHLLGVTLFLMFYLTPVFWDSAQLAPRFQPLMQINPVGQLLAAYRSILVHEQWPDAASLLRLCLISVAVLSLGYWIFLRARNRFVEEL